MIRWLLDLLFPPRCILCHKIMDSSREPVCDSCGRLILAQSVSVMQGKRFARCVAPLSYDGVVRDSVHRFKFHGRKFYAKTYALWMAAAIRQELEDCDVMTWVPVSRKRLRKRGYDQSRELCLMLSGLLDAQLTACVVKIRDNPAQSSISDRRVREKNVKGVYHAINPEDFSGKRVLLVDDVVTTGATLEECSRVLLSAGAREVFCAAVAQAK